MNVPRPFNLVAELTYRCPLRCVYCSNPIEYSEFREDLDAPTWTRVFSEAADLGVLHVGLTGGEPSLREDLEEIVQGAASAQLYPHLVTAGNTLSAERLAALCDEGLKSVQLSIQDSQREASDRIAGVTAFDEKLRFAQAVKELGLPLSLNVPLHRDNLSRVEELISLAHSLGAHRIELANTQYHGWALLNRGALLPSKSQLRAADTAVAEGRRRFPDLEILFVLPDYYSDRPKPCMGGWAQKNIVIPPHGVVLPCHAAGEITGLEFWKVTEHSLADCWARSPGMNAYRGQAWLPEPCRSCPDRERDFGGCRCQAFALTGDSGATDPACSLSPQHEIVLEARRLAESEQDRTLIHRGPSRVATGS
ncbi:pyrroloquinoline quinone biosynthesis protein PqqE [Myxococcota bacterium]|nr:pyrroloquinoline quinone biosynthesis protein PqqE [Myxococcota bacterium]